MVKVELLRYTPDGEKLIAAAARLCYSPIGVNEIEESLNEEKVESFLSLLMDLNHESPIEHVTFTFGVEGVSRTLTHQLVRHRIASFSQQSQRYVKLEQFEYIIPPAIANNKRAREIFENAMKEDQKNYNEISNLLFNEYYSKYINLNYNEKEARNKAEKESIEDARYIFPNACETKIVFTMNARSLMNFFKLRCCNRAQWEIRELAILMLIEVKKIYPTLFKNAGPGCINGPCPEGKMTCGKISEVREKFMT
ncbi:thymidylate synthase (FAD) [Tissierella praeacuta DSM 18095]|uniref:Flavin-dependent thymidylate synthase n=1 Tax=Tissierella praeacuta DSM 18095 TaxID=1123404 RepID=A0A1M4Y0N5_9FIRM|nr:FAD-dependent thymidylate synthase [Tissierella praeacuta]TCU69730.1 thymidylate synthase (FAD) [Tissierella praeacuta]SHE99229.1 thymidylate synthase (FAD) [Tissierella praeacuta DSM 18095]SUP03342.1 Thymidylate synthase thyX [Tissierella praeacuta]